MKAKAVVSKKESSVTRLPKDKSFPIVAIGASSGGLDAVTQLLKALLPNTGMAFIYVQHLSPDHKSILTSLLAKSTKMTVQEVTNKVLMQQNHFYVIPPDKEMIVLDGHIKLMPRRKDRITNLPIDTFFTSLAEKHASGAIGIILSGNASDGSKGIVAIKEAGGLTFAQDDSAKFSSMPKSAIGTGTIDFVLSPKEIAGELNRISKEGQTKEHIPAKALRSEVDIANSNPDLKTILQLLHRETGVDFSHYKMATIKRRIIRRMHLYKIKTLSEYAKLVSKNTDDINILYRDLLINVTGFFRDTQAHAYLKSTLLPKLLKSKGAGESLRIWIPACSTGEEAYSIAIAILEIQSIHPSHIPVQIFATDLSEQAIAKARLGEYTVQELAAVSPKRLQRFCVKSGSHYRMIKAVRDICVFAPHNILRDPPFSKVDLISCCNLLIYLDTAAQKKVFSTFHYALNDGGYMMLGKSETAGSTSQLFINTNKKFKIYLRKKKPGARKLPELLPRTPPVTLSVRQIPAGSQKRIPAVDNHFDSTIDAVLLLRYMPASVVINHAMEILQFRGDTDHYLKHSSGKASLNILKMVPAEIAFELRSAVSKVIKTKLQVRKSAIEIKTASGTRLVNIEVVPVAIEWEEPLLFVVFTEPEQVEPILQTGKGQKSNSLAKDRRIKKLEEELLATRADMHAFTLEQEVFNEELQSANEEVVSSNEELQSVNEELETSKEEIESANEELITTNQELQTRNDLLNESYDYSEAIIATIHEPMIILDKDLRITSANKSFYKNFRVNEEETEGILLYDLGNKQWDIPVLRQLLENIIPKNTQFNNFEVSHTFPGAGEKIMLLNARRIVQNKHGIQLILLAIHDVTELRMKTQELLRKEKELFNRDAKEQKIEKVKLEKAVAERTQELALANDKLVAQSEEKEKWTTQLIIANNELVFQNTEKEKRAAELVIANKELAFQNETKAKLASELIIANKELIYQNGEKEKRAAELIISNKELEAFAYVSSHDLQEPLRKIQTFATRLLQQETDNLSPTGKDYFRRMQMAAGRMQTLIEDLLAYSRTNSTEKKFQKTDLNLILEEVKADLKDLIIGQNATIETRDMCQVNIIPFQFRQLMNNLLGNALKFASPSRPLHIIVESRVVKGNTIKRKGIVPEKDYCHISFSDNGIGFDPIYQERIFEVFQKLHGREEYAGTGIGLAIVKKIIENHHGIIEATGVLNEGATFDIYIPVE